MRIEIVRLANIYIQIVQIQLFFTDLKLCVAVQVENRDSNSGLVSDEYLSSKCKLERVI